MALTEDLAYLRDHFDDLMAVASRKASVATHTSGTHGSYTVAPTPLNLGAWRLVESIRTFATASMRLLRLPCHDAETSDMLRELAKPHRIAQLASSDMAAEVESLARQAVERMGPWLTRAETHVMVGRCPDCGRDLWASESDVDGGWMVCACDATIRISDVAQSRIWRLSLSGAQGTAAALGDLLKACGVPIKRKTINEWRRRGIIQPIARQDGSPVYRLWDVWQAAHRNDNQQAKEEDHISDCVAA